MSFTAGELHHMRLQAGALQTRPGFGRILNQLTTSDHFRDDQAVRYLQVGVSLMSHEQAALDAAKEAQPVIRNELLMLFSGQNYENLIDAAGKQKLQAQALAAVQKIISARTGKPGIDALYFTSFVMQ